MKNGILTWQGSYHDHESGLPQVRLTHCTLGGLTDFSKHGKLVCITSGRGGLHSHFSQSGRNGQKKWMYNFPKRKCRWPTGTWKDCWSSGKCKSKSQWAVTAHLSEWLSTKRRQMTNVVRMWRKGNTCTLLGGMWIAVATMETVMEVSQKTKNRTTIWPSNSTPG